MDFIEKYVKEHLATELEIIQASSFHTSINLTDYEKTIIYKYSDDGFRDINKVLRVSKGASFNEFGILLYTSISKLPSYWGIVYRKVYLTDTELDLYIQAFSNQTIIVEYPFISTSKFISVAILWAGITGFIPNCVFVIYIRTGKEIELMSKFNDEKEVLLKPNTQFNVLNIVIEPDFIQITMEEQL